MKRIVAGTILALFGLLSLLASGRNVDGPAGNIIIGAICIACGGTLDFYGARNLRRKKAELIRQGFPASPPATLRDVVACIVAWVCGFLAVAFVGFIAQLLHLSEIEGLGGAIIGMFVLVIGIGSGVRAGKAAYRILRGKKDSISETVQQMDAPQLFSSSQPPVIPPPSPEPFTFSCPHCSQHISATSESIGIEGECPTCQNSITIPSPNQ